MFSTFQIVEKCGFLKFLQFNLVICCIHAIALCLCVENEFQFSQCTQGLISTSSFQISCPISKIKNIISLLPHGPIKNLDKSIITLSCLSFLCQPNLYKNWVMPQLTHYLLLSSIAATQHSLLLPLFGRALPLLPVKTCATSSLIMQHNSFPIWLLICAS